MRHRFTAIPHGMIKKSDSTHYLQIAFKGDKMNINGLGALAEIFYDKGKHQVYEHDPYTAGYLSSYKA
jgi:hypothetical protein